MKRRRAGEADRNLPLLSTRGPPRRGEGMVETRQDLARISRQCASGLGEFHTARPPPQQLHAQFSLQRAHPLAQRGLLHAQPFGGTGNVPLLGDGDAADSERNRAVIAIKS